MIDSKNIEHIASLARLRISPEEAKEYSEQLAKSLDFFKKISEINTEGVEPMITPTEIEAYWRQDELKNEFSAEEMTDNAPSKAGNLFKVPPVV